MSHTMSRLGRLTSVVLALVAVLVLAGGGPSKDDQSSSSSSSSSSSGTADNAGGSLKKGLTVAFLPKQVNNPYFSISDKGGLDTLKTLGEKGKRVGPSDANASSQVSYINTLTSQKVDAIAISASDPNAVTPSLRKAMQ